MSIASPMHVNALIDPEALEGALFGPLPQGIPDRFTEALNMTVLDAGEGISDLIFSPGRPAQVERHGQGGRIAVLEILKATLRTREYLEKGDSEGRSLLDAMRDGELDGMQCFDVEMVKLVQMGVISVTTAVQYSTNPDNLRVELAQTAPSDLDDIIVR